MVLTSSLLGHGGQQQPLRDAWFSVGLMDKAAFLNLLANSALHLSSMRKGGLPTDETTVAVKYHMEAVSIVSKRLEVSVSKGQSLDVSDETIGAVSGLICNAVSRHPPPRCFERLLVLPMY